MRLAASFVVAALMLSLLYAQTLSSDGELELAGRWTAMLPTTVIGTGNFRSLVIQKYSSSGSEYHLTIIHGTTGTVGVNEKALHIFRKTTIETGPYILSRDGNRFVYRDENKQTNYLAIVLEKVREIDKTRTIDKTYTNLNDGKYQYYREGPKLP